MPSVFLSSWNSNFLKLRVRSLCEVFSLFNSWSFKNNYFLPVFLSSAHTWDWVSSHRGHQWTRSGSWGSQTRRVCDCRGAFPTGCCPASASSSPHTLLQVSTRADILPRGHWPSCMTAGWQLSGVHVTQRKHRSAVPGWVGGWRWGWAWGVEGGPRAAVRPVLGHYLQHWDVWLGRSCEVRSPEGSSGVKVLLCFCRLRLWVLVRGLILFLVFRFY